MKINVYYPTNKAKILELTRLTAKIHADAVIQYIEKISHTNEYKVSLINRIIEDVRYKKNS